MSVRMRKASFTLPVDDRKKVFFENYTTPEERRAAFMGDEELMAELNMFISDIIEEAANEAKRRSEPRVKSSEEGNKSKGGQALAGWNNRARGFCNRVWNAVFPCFNNNELLTWTQPFRYRFSRH